MSGPWARYLERTLKIARDTTARAVSFHGFEANAAPKVLFKYRSQADIAQHVVGSDKDIGGKSTAQLDLGPDGRGRFWGDMRLEVPAGKEGKMRSGYAGFRNRSRPTLFGNITEDLSLHPYLALRVRASGEPKTRTAYFVNLQNESPLATDLWQHRLYLQQEEAWENIIIPLESFVLTSAGNAATDQVTMMQSKVRTVGISILGGHAQVSGKFELGIDFVGAIHSPNDLDALLDMVDGPPTPSPAVEPAPSPVSIP